MTCISFHRKKVKNTFSAILCLHCMYVIIYTYSMNTKKRPNKHSLHYFKSGISDLWPLAKGSLAEVHKPCIRPDCPACASGKKHRAFIFSSTKKGRRRCMYVPLELVAVLQRAIRNSRRLEDRMSDMGPEMIRQFRKQQALLKSSKNKKHKV